MTTKDILTQRLANQGLSCIRFDSPTEVVGWFGAMQSQDYLGAKWSVGQRLKNFTEALMDESLNKGEIVRTHVMRPTWHFILPEDLGWMLKLTAPRVKHPMNYYNRKLDLTEDVFKYTQIIS